MRQRLQQCRRAHQCACTVAGLGDYKDRNEEGHQLFAAKGYAVWTFDAHGHGDSEPHEASNRVAIMQFSHLVDDTELFLEEVVRPWVKQQQTEEDTKALPLVLHGTSMGGLVVCFYAY